MLMQLFLALREIIGHPEEMLTYPTEQFINDVEIYYFVFSGVLVCLTVAFVFKFLLKLVDR